MTYPSDFLTNRHPIRKIRYPTPIAIVAPRIARTAVPKSPTAPVIKACELVASIEFYLKKTDKRPIANETMPADDTRYTKVSSMLVHLRHNKGHENFDH